jgi:hypothetical protein
MSGLAPRPDVAGLIAWVSNGPLTEVLGIFGRSEMRCFQRAVAAARDGFFVWLMNPSDEINVHDYACRLLGP